MVKKQRPQAQTPTADGQCCDDFVIAQVPLWRKMQSFPEHVHVAPVSSKPFCVLCLASDLAEYFAMLLFSALLQLPWSVSST